MPALDSQPQIHEELSWYVQAFSFLDGRRTNNGFGELPIQLSEMEAYCRLFGVDDQEDREIFVYLMVAADQAVMKLHREKSKRNEAARKNPATPSSGTRGRRR